MSTIRVYHNITVWNPDDLMPMTRFSHSYMPGDKMVKVFEYLTITKRTPEEWADWAFRWMNMDSDMVALKSDRTLAVAYRRAGNRSLSLGDVVVIQTAVDAVALAVDVTGWTRMPLVDMKIVRHKVVGTTPFEGAQTFLR